jgi:hypothetical protein
MILLHSLLPWLGQFLMMAILFSMLVQKLATHQPYRFGLIFILLALGFFIPLGGSTLAQWLRSVVGDLSVLTLVIFADILCRRLWNLTLLDTRSRKSLLLVAGLLGVVFYPLALGYGPVDTYRVGYAPLMMVYMLGLTSVIVWIRHARMFAVILLLPLLAYNLHLLESDNLWNYLLDPLLVIYALVQSAGVVLKQFKLRRGMQKK